MPTRRSPRRPEYAELLQPVAGRLKGPFLVVQGSPREATELVRALPEGEVVCWQMDLYQADRLRQELAAVGAKAEVATSADLWDQPRRFETAIYPSPFGGERGLKIDLVEQAYHVLNPRGAFVVLSPYQRDDLFPTTMKKVFGKVHCPMDTENAVFWSLAGEEKERRRHEQTFHVRVDEGMSLEFLSRPGVFSYGKFDYGARALVEATEIQEGDRIADLGCGCGTNGILTALQAGPEGSVAFADSNLRALALADLNARRMGVLKREIRPSIALEGLERDSFDVVLANPPYYAHLGIARLFMTRGREILKPGGRFRLVSKQIDAVHGLMNEAFGSCEIGELRGYFIFEATKE